LIDLFDVYFNYLFILNSVFILFKRRRKVNVTFLLNCVNYLKDDNV